MQDLLLNFGNWLQNSAVGLFVSGTSWGYPFVRLIHILGLSLWVGTIAMLDLRLLGLAGRRYTLLAVAELLSPLAWTGLGLALIGGFLLFSGIASSYVQNAAFRLKFPLVLLGIAYHIVIQRNIPKWSQSAATPPLAKLSGCVELALWLGILITAVEIPNYA